MQNVIRIHDLETARVLVTRASARTLAPAIREALDEGSGEAVLDFSGVDGITPSFLDEVLVMIDESVASLGLGDFGVTIVGPPTRLSSKFEAVGRSHGLTIAEQPSGTWRIAQI